MEKKVLVVDDEYDILNMLAGYLEDEGFEVNTASNGREAVERFQSDPVPVVVTDMRMPGMDGLAVMRRVKELDEDVEVIILTAYAALDNVIEAFQYNQGAFDYLTKPLEDIGQLVIAIGKAQESRRLRVENKTLLEQLKQAKANLEKRVEERTAELRETNQRLIHELDQRKRAEAALRESEERYRDLFENANDLIQAVSTDGRFLYANRAWRDTLGYSSEEVKKLNVFDIIAPESQDHCQDIFQQVFSGEKIDKVEAAFITKDGRRITVEGSINCKFENGTPIRTRAIFRDITARKLAEIALQESEARIRTIRDTAVDAIITIGENGIVESFNTAAERIFGYDVSEVLGNDVNMLMPEPFHSQHPKCIQRYLGTGKRNVIGAGREAVGLRKDGTEFPLELSVSEVIVNEKRLFTGIIRDITERKRVENALRDSEERYRDLVENAEDIIYQTDALGHFTYVNPIAIKRTGFSEDELIGKNYLELIHPDAQEAATKFYGTQFIKKKPSTYLEFPIVTQSGEIRWVGQHVKLLTEGDKVKGFHSVARDITQQKTAEEALAEARTREVEIGAKIQETLLLSMPPRDIQGLAISALTIPSQRIDGDFYDFFKHTDRITDFIIGDVMGKGVPAALLGAGAKTQFLRSLNHLISTSDQLPEPEVIVQHVHQALVKEFIDLEVFMTLCYSRFDLDFEKLFFVDCGHTKTIHFRPETGTLNLLEGFNLPFGCDEGETYRQVEVQFQPGDLFFFYSDGITEARRGSDDFFGLERLMECVRTNAHLGHGDLIGAVRDAVIRFSSSESFSDDLTCAAIIIEGEDSLVSLAHLEMEVSSDMANLEEIRSMVQRTYLEAKITDIDEESVWQMELVLNEAAANIIKHAYQLRKDGRIKIESQVFKDKFVYYLHHWGEDFERETIPHPPFDGEQESGYGLYIIDSYMDEVTYSADESGRKSVCLIKNRN